MIKKILLITKNTERTAEMDFAGRFAAQNELTLVVAETQSKKQRAYQTQPALAQHGEISTNMTIAGGKAQPDILQKSPAVLKPQIVNTSLFSDSELVAFIRKGNFAMVISSPSAKMPNLQDVLDLIPCPLLLLPEVLPSAPISRMAYLTDLRYCQQPVLNHLSELRGSSLLLAHICQQGLPDVSPAYGEALFADTIGRRNARFELFFSHIKDTDMPKVADTLINTLHVDILVCLNRQYHFKKLWGEHLPNKLPSHITVPVLIYPN